MKIKKSFNLVSLLFLFYVFVTSCAKIDSRSEAAPVISDKPLHKESFLSLQKINSIELTGNNYDVSWITEIVVDENKNIYALAPRDGYIAVFDKDGGYVKKLGSKGLGPSELSRPRLLSYSDNKLYISEGFSQLKVWDTGGDYIETIAMKRSNQRSIRIIDNDVVAFRFQVISRSKLYAYSLERDGENIFSYEQNEWEDFKFRPWDALALTENGQFYFPESAREYLISKYDENGNKILTFGREYQPVEYSKEARSTFDKKFGEKVRAGRMGEPSIYPPVVRYMFTDVRNNLWVVSGETPTDSDGLGSAIPTVDIFSEDGVWLTSFQSKYFTAPTLIKDDRLYTFTRPTMNSGLQYIYVFQVEYSDEGK